MEGALDGIGWEEKGRRGGEDRMVGKGREGEGRGVVVKLLFHFLKLGRSRVIQASIHI